MSTIAIICVQTLTLKKNESELTPPCPPENHSGLCRHHPFELILRLHPLQPFTVPKMSIKLFLPSLQYFVYLLPLIDDLNHINYSPVMSQSSSRNI